MIQTDYKIYYVSLGYTAGTITSEGVTVHVAVKKALAELMRQGRVNPLITKITKVKKGG